MLHAPSGIELVLIAVVALLLFGPKRLPEMGRSLGKGIREFKNGVSGIMNGEEEQKPQATETKVETVKVETVKVDTPQS